MKKTAMNRVPVLTEYEPTPKLKRAMREVNAGRGVISLGTYEEAKEYFRRLYERNKPKAARR